MKKFFKIVLYIVGIYSAYVLISGDYPLFVKKALHITTNDDVPDSDSTSNAIPPDYSKILKLKQSCCGDSDTSKFYFTSTEFFKLRNPISFFVYKKKYTLQIYKISSDCKQPLDKYIIEKYINVKKTMNLCYTMFDKDNIVYLYKASLPLKVSKVYLTLDGKDNRTITKNDSVVYYYSMLNNFSIQYQLNVAHDIFGETGIHDGFADKKKDSFFSSPKPDYQPFEMLFLKRNNSLYLLMMAANKKDIPYSPGTLYNLVK